MAVRTRDEILDLIKGRIGDDVSDEALALLEDVTDTYDDLTTRAGEDWRKKYEDNDASWRKKYKERFLRGKDVDEGENNHVEDPEEPETKSLKFEDLFEEKEEK